MSSPAAPTLEEQLSQALERLTSEQQQQVLDYARLLGGDRIGVPGTTLLRFAGLIPPEDLAEMAAAIEDCERIDVGEW
jgi:hypothetical protein